jgi:phosphoglycerol transferase MdoB-like AlkP superfamily enzyme
MMLGIVGCVFIFVPDISLVAIVLTLLAVFVSWNAFGKIRRGEQSGYGMAVTGLLCGIIGSLLYGVGSLVILHATDVGRFNTAARDLYQMLTVPGSTDSEVVAACSAVEDAYQKVDRSEISKEQADAMQNIANSAKLWKIQLTLTKIDAIRGEIGQDTRNDAATDIDVGRMVLPGIRSSLASYLKEYN